MISSIKIENLRSLKDTGYIELRPITILIGTNSSGKSTFLRTFPLLSQTVSHNLRTAIAWYDESSVDFGDFATSKTRNSDKDYIKFSFKINLSNYVRIPYSYSEWKIHKNALYGKEWNLSICYKQRTDGKGVYVDSIEVGQEGNVAKFILSEKRTVDIFFNDKSFPNFDFSYTSREQTGLIPNIYFQSSDPDLEMEEIRLTALQSLRKYCSKRMKHVERLLRIWGLWNEDKEKFLENLHKYSDIKSLSDTFKKWDIDNKEFHELYESIYVVKILNHLKALNLSLNFFFNNCDYVAPLRAEASRYTRFQGLQVNRVDAFGRNLSEFIDSLTDTQYASLNDYIDRLLRVRVKVRNVSGHQSMVLLKDGMETNMADVGFGYSQILPIITKLWQMQERARFSTIDFYRSPYAVGLIEQPELHLHPALQAKLADAFVKAALNEDSKTTLIIETHSPTIINRIGRRIREGHLSADKVNVVIFEKIQKDGFSKVTNNQFQPDGRIKDWPFGFFEPENDSF